MSHFKVVKNVEESMSMIYGVEKSGKSWELVASLVDFERKTSASSLAGGGQGREVDRTGTGDMKGKGGNEGLVELIFAEFPLRETIMG